MEKVDILLSVFNPNIDFLIKQLQSLNNQTYHNIELFIFDDCIDKRVDRQLIKRYFNRFPITFVPNLNNNIGFFRAFEYLLKQSNGKYIALCDQDDVWHNDKIEKSIKVLKDDNSLLVASDHRIINQNDEVVSESARKNDIAKNYNRWKTGDDIAKYNLFVTYAIGNCLVADGDFARSTIPFGAAQDKWLINCAAIEGIVSFIDEPLVDYRRHGNNVSGFLAGVNTKKEYYDYRIIVHENIYKEVLKKYPKWKDRDEVGRFINARKTHNRKQLRRYSYLAPDIVKFELLISYMPSSIFKLMLKIIRLKK
ncbi:MAG: glycosyltransferase [Thomasclavelia sp.]|nr:glycosyltransferase [Thomasclavelia sp.]